MSRAQNTPTMKVSMIRNATMNSLMRVWIECQELITQSSVSRVLRITNHSEMPSTPTW